MAHTCPTCGTVRHSTYTRGSLVARDEPFEIYHAGRIIHLTRSQVIIAYELVRFGRISRDRIYELAPNSERGLSDALPATRIAQIREKLAAAGAPERITPIYGYGYQLEIAP